MANCKFPKKARIPSKKDFRAIFDYKLFSRNDLMTLYIAPNSLKTTRFAVSISSKIAPAAARNRLKRLAREAFRLSQNEVLPGLDYLIIYSPMLSKKPCSDIKKTALSKIKGSFIELARQGQKRFEKRTNK